MIGRVCRRARRLGHTTVVGARGVGVDDVDDGGELADGGTPIHQAELGAGWLAGRVAGRNCLTSGASLIVMGD